ncbi:MAG: hypothetical protein GY847_38955 [Proteobacteria bacterium]|nr:hypothetical protein [Pseudomonadota bacterium]
MFQDGGVAFAGIAIAKVEGIGLARRAIVRHRSTVVFLQVARNLGPIGNALLCRGD